MPRPFVPTYTRPWTRGSPVIAWLVEANWLSRAPDHGEVVYSAGV